MTLTVMVLSRRKKGPSFLAIDLYFHLDRREERQEMISLLLTCLAPFIDQWADVFDNAENSFMPRQQCTIVWQSKAGNYLVCVKLLSINTKGIFQWGTPHKKEIVQKEKQLRVIHGDKFGMIRKRTCPHNTRPSDGRGMSIIDLDCVLRKGWQEKNRWNVTNIVMDVYALLWIPFNASISNRDRNATSLLCRLLAWASEWQENARLKCLFYHIKNIFYWSAYKRPLITVGSVYCLTRQACRYLLNHRNGMRVRFEGGGAARVHCKKNEQSNKSPKGFISIINHFI